MLCNICGSDTSAIFEAMLLGKYMVTYYQCNSCEFIQTEKPYWLNEAYTSAIATTDVGLVFRNIQFAGFLPSVLDLFSGPSDSYLDYGGGYGMLVRIMRDRGYDFYLDDKYAENLFAKYFELNDFPGKGKFKAVTAFEVFEHFDAPMDELARIFALSDSVIFSTEMLPRAGFATHEDWWYFMPDIGQHISFYSRKSLEFIASKFNCRLYSNGTNMHVISSEKMDDPFGQVNSPGSDNSLLRRIIKILRGSPTPALPSRASLLPPDLELYKRMVVDQFHSAGD